MKSTITLYAGVRISTNKNMAVDNLTTYLSSIGSGRIKQFTDQNYQKHELMHTVKLPIGQEALDFSGGNWNYCSITNLRDNGVPEKTAYYFIKSKKWTSKEILTLELYMDTINTIGYNIKLTNRTLIHRQHKDRYYINSGYAYGIVDKTAENLQPQLYMSKEKVVNNNDLVNDIKWYLLFMTESDPEPTEYNQINPVHNYIVPQYKMPYHTSGGLHGYSTLDDGIKYIISSGPNNTNGVGNMQILGSPDTNLSIVTLPPDFTSPNFTKYVYKYAVIWRVGSTGYYEYYKASVGEDGSIIQNTLIDSGSWNSFGFGNTFPGRVAYYKAANPTITPLYEPNGYFTEIDTREIAGFDSIDRTNPKIIKIVELPYCPLPVGGVYNNRVWFNIPTKGVNLFNGYLLEVNGFADTLKRNISSINNPIQIEWRKLKRNLSQSILWERSKLFDTDPLEPKLYCNELFEKKFVYDSFSYLFDFEEVDVENSAVTTSQAMTFDFVTSLAITSKFAFDFSKYWRLKNPKSDYASILLCARNNEISVYNNQYLNYLRTGLQYDLKNKERQEKQSAITTALTGIGAAASIGIGIASMNPAITISSVIAGATAVTNSVVSAVNQSISLTQAIEQKKEQLRNQSTSVSTSDDLPLMRYYTEGNFAKICTYEPSEVMSANLLKLFHYTGYKCEYMAEPSLNTRLRFNYIQADIDIDESVSGFLTRNYSEDIIEDYKARFQVGLFIIHYYNNTWDFEMKYENWETIFSSYLN